MKVNIIISTLTLLLSFNFFQTNENFKEDKIGHVVYKIGRNTSGTPSSIKITDQQKESFKKIDEEFEALKLNLFFTKNESLFEIEDALSNDKNDDFESKFAKMLAGGLCYKNISNKEKIEQIESFNEVFNVVKPYDEYVWTISNESKIINGFKCYKATTVKEQYDEVRKMTRKFSPTVWFAPEIPVSFGPKGLDGLPGLVLEATFNGTIYYYATNINLDYKGKIKIAKPSKGKYVTEKEFFIIDAENFKKNSE